MRRSSARWPRSRWQRFGRSKSISPTPEKLPTADTARWFVINRLRTLIQRRELPPIRPDMVNRFLESLPNEFRFAVLVDLVDRWAEMGADNSMFVALKEVTGL